MKFCFIFIMLSKEMNQFLVDTIRICSNTSMGEPLKCCANYRQVGKTCEECWPGTYGIDCTPCPRGFYGVFCKLSCHNLCTSCDPVIGCTDFTESETSINSGEIIHALLGGFGGIVALLVGLIVWKNAFEEQYNYDALQKNDDYEEVVNGQEDPGTESVRQINIGQNMYIDICD